MTEERRKKLLLIAGVLVLIVILLMIVFNRQPAAPAPQVPAEQAAVGQPSEVTAPNPAVPVTSPLLPSVPAPVDARADAVQTAELFAERYGSYSNQAKYENLADLLSIMTDGFRADSEKLIAKAGAATSAPEYEGVTSRKISSKVNSYSEKNGQADVTVTLQQTQRTAQTSSINYRTIRIKLVQTAGLWLVDSAAWGENVGG